MRGKKVLFILSLTVLVLFLLVGVFADFLAPCDPNAVDMANGLAAPSTEHWLGTDHIGRDLLSRLIYGSRSSVFIAFFATGCTLLLGMTIGLVSGYLGGWIDQLRLWSISSKESPAPLLWSPSWDCWAPVCAVC